MSAFPNVQILFGRKVIKVFKNRVFYKHLSKDSMVKEESIVVAGVVVCTGYRPNTNIMRQFMNDSMSLNGFVSVNPFFQVRKGVNTLKIEELVKETRKIREKETLDLINQTIVDPKEEEVKEALKESSEMPHNAFEEIKELKDLSSLSSFRIDDKTYPNIFAIGDVVDSTEEKLAKHAVSHGKVVAKNLIALEYFSTRSSGFGSPRGGNGMVAYEFGTHEVEGIYAMGKTGMMVRGEKVMGTGIFFLKLKDIIENSVKNFK
jgi:thioredoxin reductase